MSRGQSQINQVWSTTWKERSKSNVTIILQTRLTVEGFRTLERHVPENVGAILEVGTGTGRFGALIARARPDATITMTDILSESLTVARSLVREMGVENVFFQKADARKLPFLTDSFDVVLSDAVVQHLPDEQVAWNEMARVLKPGGTMIVSIINRWNPHTLFKRLQGMNYNYGFERSYSHRDIRRRAYQAGLAVESSDGFFPAYGVTRLARRQHWIKPLGRAFDLLCRLGDRLTAGWVSKMFGFEIVVVAKKPIV